MKFCSKFLKNTFNVHVKIFSFVFLLSGGGPFSFCSVTSELVSEITCIHPFMTFPTRIVSWTLFPEAIPEANPLPLVEGAVYMKYQVERCPDTGRLHLQGCLRSQRPLRLGGFRELMSALGLEGAHIEPAIHWPSLKEYCGKEESRVDGPWEVGSDAGQGARTDLKRVGEELKAGKTLREVAMEDPQTFMKYPAGLTKFRALLMQPSTRVNLRVTVRWGAPGTGKSRAAFSEEGAYSLFSLRPLWADGYDGEKVVVIDDVHPFEQHSEVEAFKKLIDIHPFRAPVKGGSVPWNPERIIITSNFPPEVWWSRAPLEITRRLHQIFHYAEDGTVTQTL